MNSVKRWKGLLWIPLVILAGCGQKPQQAEHPVVILSRSPVAGTVSANLPLATSPRTLALSAALRKTQQVDQHTVALTRSAIARLEHSWFSNQNPRTAGVTSAAAPGVIPVGAPLAVPLPSVRTPIGVFTPTSPVYSVTAPGTSSRIPSR